MADLILIDNRETAKLVAVTVHRERSLNLAQSPRWARGIKGSITESGIRASGHHRRGK